MIGIIVGAGMLACALTLFLLRPAFVRVVNRTIAESLRSPRLDGRILFWLGLLAVALAFAGAAIINAVLFPARARSPSARSGPRRP